MFVNYPKVAISKHFTVNFFQDESKLSATTKLSSGDEAPPIAKVLLCIAFLLSISKYILVLVQLVKQMQ